MGDNVEIGLAFNIAVIIVGFLFGWLVKTLFDRIRDLETADREVAKALGDLRVELAQHYTHKAEFKDMGDNIFEALRRIEDKLDRKADKVELLKAAGQ